MFSIDYLYFAFNKNNFHCWVISINFSLESKNQTFTKQKNKNKNFLKIFMKNPIFICIKFPIIHKISPKNREKRKNEFFYLKDFWQWKMWGCGKEIVMKGIIIYWKKRYSEKLIFNLLHIIRCESWDSFHQIVFSNNFYYSSHSLTP